MRSLDDKLLQLGGEAVLVHYGQSGVAEENLSVVLQVVVFLR